MKLRDYLKDKIIIIILVILTYFIILSFMIGLKLLMNLDGVLQLFTFCFLLLSFCMIISGNTFFIKKYYLS